MVSSIFFFFYLYLQIQIFLKGTYDFCNMLYKICSIAQWCPTLCSPWTVGCQAPMSTEFSKQVYWSGLPFPPQGNLPNLGIEAESFVSCIGRHILYHLCPCCTKSKHITDFYWDEHVESEEVINAVLNGTHLICGSLLYDEYSIMKIKVIFCVGSSNFSIFRKWTQSCHVQMWELAHREDWAPKNWCFQIGAREDSWGSLGQQEIKLVNP